MRSDLVAQAARSVSNRFLLVHATTAITRKFHRPNQERLQESINGALAGLGHGKYVLTGNVVGMGEVDLDWFNGFTGEGQYSYVKSGHEPEPTPEERMAVCSALLGANAVVETA